MSIEYGTCKAYASCFLLSKENSESRKMSYVTFTSNRETTLLSFQFLASKDLNFNIKRYDTVMNIFSLGKS